MDSWEKFNEILLPGKKDFYSELTLEDISDKDYEHAQKVVHEYCTDVVDYQDLYVQTDKLLLADGFEKFREKCIEIYGLDPSYFYSAPGLAWQACLKKTEVKLELLTDINILMIEKGIRAGMCQSTHRYAKANNEYKKNCDNKIMSSYLTYLHANNLYGWAMSQKLPANGFMWYNNHLSDFNEDLIKNYTENSDEGYFLDVDIEYPKQLWSSHKDLPFLPKRRKLEEVEKLIYSIEDKEKYAMHI